MKNLFLGMLFFAGTTMALAQADKQDDQQEVIQDKMEQEPLPPAQVRQERSARIEAQRIENERVVKKAEKKVAKRQAKRASREEPLKK